MTTGRIDAAALREVAASTVERYERRLREHGRDARALGWGDGTQQQYRFAQTLRGPVEFGGRSVLDIGCGFGDYRRFLLHSVPGAGAYEGWDITPGLIAEAEQLRAADDHGARFVVANLMAPDWPRSADPVADIGVMLGVLNFNLGPALDNYAYTGLALRRAWSLCRHALIVDFLSTELASDYEPEAWTFHHDPARVLQMGLALSPRVVLRHDYRPIPQREFMLFIEHA